jgi:hypothetical protein
LATGDVVKLGTLYMGSTKIARPTKPWRNTSEPYSGAGNGNIQNYSTGANLEIRDTDSNDAYKMQWVEINDGGKKYLVSDRVMLVNISWNDLNALNLIFGKEITIDGQQYRVRSLTGGSNRRNGDYYAGGTPTNNEWDRWIVNEANLSGLPKPTSADLGTSAYQNPSVMNGAHNTLWNWGYVYSWCQETYEESGAIRAIRGYDSARPWYYNNATYRGGNVGWRPVLEVLNSAPVISGNNQNLGEKITPFAIDYTVNDTDTTDTLTITEKVNNTTIRTVSNAVRNQQYTVNLSDVWSTLALGSHTVTITVDDGKGGTATRTYTFTKTDDRIKFRLKNPIGTSIAAKKIVVSGVLTIPAGATLSVKACNNAFDSSPTWEDITQKFLNREAHTFANVSKTAAKWGIDIEFEILKNNATEQIIVDGFGFSFE